MCGICGSISYKDATSNAERKTLVKQMTVKLTHRGPDDQNVWSSSNNMCTFGHSRLIVVDPEGMLKRIKSLPLKRTLRSLSLSCSGGKQPMTLSDVEGKEFTMIYNGELYNTRELRLELQGLGHTFNSYSDTEVLLRSFMVNKLVDLFFCINQSN